MPSRLLRAVQRFITEPSIASRCPSRADHRSIVEPSIATSPSCPELYRQAVQRFIAKPCIASHRPLRAVHREIVESSSALLPSRSHPSPSRPLPSHSLRRAFHRKLSITTSSSCPSLHRQAIFCELPIASRPSLHCRAVIVHHKLSVTLSPSHPALYCQAVHCQTVHCQAVYCEPSSALSPSRPLRAVFHRELTIAALPSPPLQHRQAVQSFIAKLSSALLQSCPSPSRPLSSRPFLAVHCPSPPNAKAMAIIHQC